MTLYECLGIDDVLFDESIPIDVIINNIDSRKQEDARHYFKEIKRVSIRASIKRNDHFLQVIEVELNAANFIEEISEYIQSAIKYQVLFVFDFEERYLLTYRNYTITESTQHVYTEHKSYATAWIYKECLEEDFLFWFSNNDVDDTYNDDYFDETTESLRKIEEHDDYVYFSDILQNAIVLDTVVKESDYVCLRFLLDWINMHSMRDYTNVFDILTKSNAVNNYMMFADFLFLPKNMISTATMEIPETWYLPSFTSTGRHSTHYFKNAVHLASYDDANYLRNYIVCGDLPYSHLDYENDLDDDSKRKLKKYIRINAGHYGVRTPAINAGNNRSGNNKDCVKKKQKKQFASEQEIGIQDANAKEKKLVCNNLNERNADLGKVIGQAGLHVTYQRSHENEISSEKFFEIKKNSVHEYTPSELDIRKNDDDQIRKKELNVTEVVNLAENEVSLVESANQIQSIETDIITDGGNNKPLDNKVKDRKVSRDKFEMRLKSEVDDHIITPDVKKDKEFYDSLLWRATIIFKNDIAEIKDIKEFFTCNGITCLDKIEKGGALWVVGGSELHDVMHFFNKKGRKFCYLEKGGNASNHKPAWWYK